MKKTHSIVMKLSLLTISTFIVLFIFYNLVSHLYSYEADKSIGEENLILSTEKTAFQIASRFNGTITSLEKESDTLLALIEQGQLSSDFILDYKSRALDHDANALGYSVIIRADLINNLNPALFLNNPQQALRKLRQAQRNKQMKSQKSSH